jgi:4-carboxymuconolactone decarboxylase
LTENDPDLQEMLNRFIFGEIFYQGNLTDKMRELITLVVLTTNQNLEQLKAHVWAAINIGVSPVEIKEAVYQCAPYLGFPKTLNAIQQVNEVFKTGNISLPVKSKKQVTEQTRFDEGLKVQKSIFGDIIDQMHQNAPDNQKHIQNYLSAFCFGDIYTRSGLDLKTRELLTLCILSALGGCESQVKSHVFGNYNVGNDKNTLLEAVTQCLPYMGFPRTLNAIACINEVITENK